MPQEDQEPLMSTTIDVDATSVINTNHLSTPSAHTFNNFLSDSQPATLADLSSSPTLTLGKSVYNRNPHHVPSSTHHSSERNFVRVIERNVEYLRGQFEEFFATRTGPGASLFVPVICCSILVLYVINSIAWHRKESQADKSSDDATADPAFDKHLPALVKLLTISPGSLLIPYNWLWTGLSILTYPFVELYFYQVLMDIVVVTLSTTLIDPLWGRQELVRFFLVVNIVVGVLTTSHYIGIYAWKGDAVYLYGVTIYGLTGYLAAICVTVKQLLPDSVVLATGVGKFKNNHIPMTSLFLSWILYLLNLTSGVSVITFFYGTITSWIYLRFIQFHPTNGSRGDLSDGFSFATFFPNVLQPLVSLIVNIVYSFFVKIKLIPDYSGSSPAYQSVRMLSERLTDNFRVPSTRRNQHKYHPSGDYEHLHQLTVSSPPTGNRNISQGGSSSTRIDL